MAIQPCMELIPIKKKKKNRDRKSKKGRQNCQTNQNRTIFLSLLYQQIHFNQIKSKIAAYNMSCVHVSPDVLSTLLLLRQSNLYKLQQKNYAWHLQKQSSGDDL